MINIDMVTKKKLIIGEDLENTKRWAKEVVKQWHDIRPDYVFLGETSAVPFGYVLKEAWKEAYGKESCPKFYRMNPFTAGNMMTGFKDKDSKKGFWPMKIDEDTMSRIDRDTNEFKNSIKYLNKRVKKKNPKIIVFDEGAGTGGGLYEFSKGPKRTKVSLSDSVNAMAKSLYYMLNILNKDPHIWESNQTPEHAPIRGSYYRDLPYKEDEEGLALSRRPTSKPTRGNRSFRPMGLDEKYQIDLYGEDYNALTGRIVKHPDQRKLAKELVKELKYIGKESGQELNKDLKDSLEKKVLGIIGVVCIGLGLFFSSSIIIGNVIGNTGNSSFNLVGIISLVIGLIAGLFWIKKRK